MPSNQQIERCIRSDLIKATSLLTPLFKLTAMYPRAVLQRREGSRYDMEFNSLDSNIYIDVKKVKKVSRELYLHGIGEEVGHSLHFRRRQSIFEKSSPTKQDVINAISQNVYEDFLISHILASNLVEMVGYLSGVEFLGSCQGEDAGQEYARLDRNFWSDLTLKFCIPFIAEAARKSSDRAKEQYIENPERVVSEVTKPAPETSEQRELLSHLNHGIGYRLAAKVFQLGRTARRQHLDLALECDTIEQYYEKSKQIFGIDIDTIA